MQIKTRWSECSDRLKKQIIANYKKHQSMARTAYQCRVTEKLVTLALIVDAYRTEKHIPTLAKRYNVHRNYIVDVLRAEGVFTVIWNRNLELRKKVIYLRDVEELTWLAIGNIIGSSRQNAAELYGKAKRDYGENDSKEAPWQTNDADTP